METKQGNKDTQKSRHSYGGRRRERGAEAAMEAEANGVHLVVLRRGNKR
jgi:hypothetical protein